MMHAAPLHNPGPSHVSQDDQPPAIPIFPPGRRTPTRKAWWDSAENLRSEWLLDAYQHGIFPWPTGDPSLPVPWCSPDPRAIFELDRFHVPRRLAQTCRSGKFRVTLRRRFFRRHSRLRNVRRAPRSNVADAADDSGVYPALRTGALPQRRSLARRSVGRGDLWPGHRWAVRGGIDVLSRPRCLEGGPGTPRRAASSARVHAAWISSSLRRTLHNLGRSKSRVPSICGVWRRPSACHNLRRPRFENGIYSVLRRLGKRPCNSQRIELRTKGLWKVVAHE